MSKTTPPPPSEPRENPFARSTDVDASMRLRSRFGYEIAPGDVVAVLGVPLEPLFQVVAIAPHLAPNAPPGLLRVRLLLTQDVFVPANAPVQQLVLVQPAPSVMEHGKPDGRGTIKLVE